MDVTLPPDLAKFVEEKVKSGAFASASEVVGEALLRWERFDRIHVSTLDELREKIAVGLEQLRRGEGIDGATVFEELRRRSSERRAGRA